MIWNEVPVSADIDSRSETIVTTQFTMELKEVLDAIDLGRTDLEAIIRNKLLVEESIFGMGLKNLLE